MKKYLYTAALALFMGASFTACDDDAEDGPVVIYGNAVAGACGTYTGQWAVTNDGEEAAPVDGKIVVSAGTTESTCKIVVSINGLDDISEVAEVIERPENLGYVLSNTVTSAFGYAGQGFCVVIDENGTLSDFKYQESARVGRKTVLKVYTFTGSK